MNDDDDVSHDDDDSYHDGGGIDVEVEDNVYVDDGVQTKMFRTEPVIVIVLTTGSGAFVELQCSSHVSAANGKRKFSGQVTSAGLQ